MSLSSENNIEQIEAVCKRKTRHNEIPMKGDQLWWSRKGLNHHRADLRIKKERDVMRRYDKNRQRKKKMKIYRQKSAITKMGNTGESLMERKI